MFTDAPKVTSRAAAHAADLAHWTGRLAFADPDWTLSRGPSQAIRPSESLAANPEDTRGVTAAVHHACETITRLAGSDYQQIQVAARTGRLLVPTRSLDESYDIPRPIARAPAHRVDAAIATYRDAEAASGTATTAMDQLAATTGAASRLLTAARNAIAPARGDAQNTARVGDPQVTPSTREAESAGGAQRFVRRPAAAEDRPRQPGTAARRCLERGVIGASREPPLPQRQSAREVGEPIIAAPTSDAAAGRHVPINAPARSPGASRSKEPELEL